MQISEFDRFDRRHIGPNPGEVEVMLQQLGYSSLDAFIDRVVPEVIRMEQRLQLPEPLTEAQVKLARTSVGK